MADQSTTPPGKRTSANVVTAPPVDARLHNFGEVAYVLRVSVSTVRRLVDQGAIAVVNVLGRTLIVREDLDAFIKKSRVTYVPDSDADVIRAAEEKARRSQERRLMVIADWNTGKDYFNDDGPPTHRTKRL